MEKLLTLFSTPKAFTDRHIALIQRNAIQSWKKLGHEVEIVLIGDDEGVGEIADEFHLVHIAQVSRNGEGTPLLNSIFSSAKKINHSALMAYINADVIVLPDFLDIARKVAGQLSKFLLVGQRWDMKITQPLRFGPEWHRMLIKEIQDRGRLHPPAGSDFFIFPRKIFEEIPDFAIGRAGWDNWMIFKARWEHWKVVDCTGAITVVHQDHDYSHLPGGQPHHRAPETFENIRKAGGKRTIYHLEDADAVWEKGQLKSPPLSWKKFMRELETFPLNYLHSFPLANCTFTIWHPMKMYSEILLKKKEKGKRI
jgi:hypothetical protein